MKFSRRESRVNAIKLLYTMDINDCDLSHAVKNYFEAEVDDQALIFVNDVINDKEAIDQIIEESLTNYSLSRLNMVDRSIIRLAVNELKSETPNNIVINEAIEITKEYTDLGDNKAVAFNNKLLDQIKANLNK